jgi:hypothetical protein
MKIYAPVKDATGIWASVRFVNGVGETNDPRLIEWFKTHGYGLEKCDEAPTNLFDNPILDSIMEQSNEQIEPDFDAMNPSELRDWMREHGYGSQIKNTRNKEKLLEILRG